MMITSALILPLLWRLQQQPPQLQCLQFINTGFKLMIKVYYKLLAHNIMSMNMWWGANTFKGKHPVMMSENMSEVSRKCTFLQTKCRTSTIHHHSSHTADEETDIGRPRFNRMPSLDQLSRRLWPFFQSRQPCFRSLWNIRIHSTLPITSSERQTGGNSIK